MKKKFNRPNLYSSANSSRSGSIQSRGQYSGRERGLDFSSLMLYIRKYRLTEFKMFQNKFGLDGFQVKYGQAMLATFGEEISLTGLGLRQLDGTPVFIPHVINFKEQKTLIDQILQLAHKTGAFGEAFIVNQKIKKSKSNFQKHFKKFNSQIKNSNNASQQQQQIKSDLIRRILLREEIDLSRISFSKLETELKQELQRAGGIVFLHENGVFPSQNPVLFLPMQFQNKKRCIHLMKWNNNLILVNMQREFIDQLQETYEISLDSQLTSQVNWRKKLVQAFGKDQRFKNVQYILEDILIEQQEPTMPYKVRKIRKEEQKKVTFEQSYKQRIEIETQKPAIQKKGQVTQIVGSPMFKQNLLKSNPITNRVQVPHRTLNFQRDLKGESQAQQKDAKKLQQSQLQNLVQEVTIERNKEEIRRLKNQLETKESQIQQLQSGQKAILTYKSFQGQNKLMFNSVMSNFGGQDYPIIKHFDVVQKERYDLFMEESKQYAMSLGRNKDELDDLVNFFNSPPCGEQIIKAFKSSLVQNTTTIFGYQQGSILTQTLYVEFSYSKRSSGVIAIVNNTPRFEYSRLVNDSIESYQILGIDLAEDEPRFKDFEQDGFHLNKFCDKCRFFSSEPSVDLQNDVIHYQFNYKYQYFRNLGEDIPQKL